MKNEIEWGLYALGLALRMHRIGIVDEEGVIREVENMKNYFKLLLDEAQYSEDIKIIINIQEIIDNWLYAMKGEI